MTFYLIHASLAASGGVPPALKQPKTSTKPVPQQKKDGLTGSVPTQALAPAGSIEKKQGKKDVAAPHPRMQFDDMTKVGKLKKRAIVNQSEARNRVELFRHLPQYEHGTQLPDLEFKFFQLEPIHPSVYQVFFYSIRLVISELHVSIVLLPHFNLFYFSPLLIFAQMLRQVLREDDIELVHMYLDVRTSLLMV